MKRKKSRNIQHLSIVFMAACFITCYSSTVRSEIFCVQNSSELQTALNTAATNGEADEIQIVQGTYTGNFIYEVHDIQQEGYKLTIKGGYTAGCVSRVVNASNTVLDGNSAGSVFIMSDWYGVDFECDGVTFQNGSAVRGGGAHIISKGDVTLTNNIISDNIATEFGGGIIIDSDKTICLTNNMISNNKSEYYAGGASIQGQDNDQDGGGGTLIMTANTIKGNSAEGAVGGLWTFCSSVSLINNLFDDNSASWYDGISIDIASKSAWIINNTIVSTGLTIKLAEDSDRADVYNNIIYDKDDNEANDFIIYNDYEEEDGVASNGIASMVTLLNNNFDQSSKGTYIQIPFTIDPSNLNNQNPLFVDLAAGNYNLTSNSPCIDTGTSINAPGTDILGALRPKDQGYDIGAYEYSNQYIHILTDTSPDVAIVAADNAVKIYGTAGANHITLGSGADVHLINFPGNNTITIQSDSSIFTVFRSGATVTFEGTDGTMLVMPATSTAQSIVFEDGTRDLMIIDGAVKLGSQILGRDAAPIENLPQTVVLQSSLPYDDSPSYDGADMKNMLDGFSDYSFDFYHQVTAVQDFQDKNIFFSAYSIENALAMTWAGANNNTADEMAHALHLSLPFNTFHTTLNALNVDINSRDDKVPFSGDAFQLNLVNAVWSRIGYPFLPSYLDTLSQNYNAGVSTLDFEGNPDGSRLVINQWVEDQTHEKIQNLLPEGSISSDTAVVLTNAIYFKASWYNKFNEALTKAGDFTRLDNSTVSSQMMYQMLNTRFFQGEDFDAVELPYVSSRYEEYEYPQELSMLLINPHKGKFTSVESALDSSIILSILDSLSMGQVNLSLPRFEFNSEISCKDIMLNLGMIEAFDPVRADFSKMVDPGDSSPWIDEIYHKAFIAVDEEGTEAAAATAVVMADSAIPDPVNIFVDKPFIFLIRDNITGTILFMGRVLDPSMKI